MQYRKQKIAFMAWIVLASLLMAGTRVAYTRPGLMMRIPTSIIKALRIYSAQEYQQSFTTLIHLILLKVHFLKWK